jgi:tripartite-type tricarboxylate transporter receptor subunit TctC
LSERLGQQVIVENVVGAGGSEHGGVSTAAKDSRALCPYLRDAVQSPK